MCGRANIVGSNAMLVEQLIGFSKLTWRGKVAWCITYHQQSQAALGMVAAVFHSASSIIILANNAGYHIPTLWAVLLNVIALPPAVAFGWIWAHKGVVKEQAEMAALQGLAVLTQMQLALAIETAEKAGVSLTYLDWPTARKKVEHLMHSTKATT